MLCIKTLIKLTWLTESILLLKVGKQGIQEHNHLVTAEEKNIIFLGMRLCKNNTVHFLIGILF